jgi:dihydrodipicolinate synthase/N-acetylneuraminate lyase
MAAPFPGGVFPAPPTPFTDDGIDREKAARHAHWFLDRGAHGLIVAGSGGEHVAMTMDERKALVEAVLDAVGGVAPIIVSIGMYGTQATIELGRHAVANGATAVLSTAPHYMQPTPASVRRFFSEVRSAVDAPLMFYNSPGGTGIDPAPADIVAMVDDGILQAVKQSYPDHFHLRELKRDLGDRAAVFAGHDASAFECMIDGADGWVSTFPTVFPGRARRLWDDIQAGAPLPAVRSQWDEAMPFIRFVYDGGLKVRGEPHWLEAFKTAMNLVGVDVGAPRPPFHLLEGADLERLRAIVDSLREHEER